MAIHYPPVFINEFLAEKIPAALADRFSDGLRFFPTQPTDIATLTETFPDAANDVFAVYDRMFRLRRSPFPYKKEEQLLYYFYKTSGDPVALIETTQLVQDLLDRGDDSGKDLNAWISQKWRSQGKLTKSEISIVTGISEKRNIIKFADTEFYLPYFYNTRIFQLEEARDILDFGTARTYAGNKIIIDYCWHESSPI